MELILNDLKQQNLINILLDFRNKHQYWQCLSVLPYSSLFTIHSVRQIQCWIAVSKKLEKLDIKFIYNLQISIFKKGDPTRSEQPSIIEDLEVLSQNMRE
ncbi:Hypothetical_protein [Hexamita inflata]|uniref:Hypothetical_protein n=1 Tax=Hexamita inflata TaxID=28002 RepID=A0AA86RJ24_9EUKA|nr:Hypothetical protein HINF_LOCUS55450 [Hexamita inflata]